LVFAHNQRVGTETRGVKAKERVPRGKKETKSSNREQERGVLQPGRSLRLRMLKGPCVWSSAGSCDISETSFLRTVWCMRLLREVPDQGGSDNRLAFSGV
jgi:hypothetical protein